MKVTTVRYRNGVAVRSVHVEMGVEEALDVGEAMMEAWPLPDLAWHDGKKIHDAAWSLLPVGHPLLVEAERQAKR